MDRRTELGPQPDSVPEDGDEVLAFLETVCHRTITGDPAYYSQAEFHGRIIYFCTEVCQSVFLSDPERFYATHSRRHMDPTRCEFNPAKVK
jgi:YHS domain-containing protein